MGFGEGKDCKSFWEVALGPVGELGLTLTIALDKGPKALLGVSLVVGIEDDFDVRGHLTFEVLLGDIFLRVFLKMELAALPDTGVEGSFQGGPQTGVGIRDYVIDHADASLLEAGEKLTPMNLGFGEGAGHSENDTLAITAAHARGDEGGAVPDNAVDTDFVVGGVDSEVEDLGQWAVAPLFELFIKLLVEVRYLAGRDFEAAELLHDFGDFAGADTLDIHGGNGGLEGAITSRTLLEQRGVERGVAMSNLRDGELERAQGGLEGAGFETISVAVALDVSLMWSGSDVAFAFEEHGSVHEKFGDLGEGILQAVFEKEVDEGVVGIILSVFVHDFV